tara:strand:+ start:43 stop:798 length:756 start_codon:yes stop_codon:yes gene_type:complete
MIKLDIKSNLPKGVKWTNEMTRQLPYSAATALNASVQGSKFIAGSKQKSALNALAGSSRRYLDKPKPQTQKGWRATRANKNFISTTILPKDRPFDRNRYLSGNILGGNRAPKDFGAALVNHPQARNIPKGSRLVPTGAIKTDRYGNISKGNINKLFQNVGTGNTTGENIFIGKPRGGSRPSGVYRRERTFKLRPLFYAVSSVSYPSIFPAKPVVEKSVQQTFGLYLRHELAKNVAKRVKEGKADLKTGILW